ncbi:acetyl-CoA carboxylase carboxyl transferase subunit alpha [Actinoalloteichus sp. AHMU CJ021]|nr:acetyl-CoA carboxylase carboxyl transferase subunit alpha [Actinoalloteichus sp. AHMU CJ021]
MFAAARPAGGPSGGISRIVRLTTDPPTASPGTAGTDGAWLACPGCRSLVYRRRYLRLLDVCPDCGRHGRLPAAARAERLLDAGSPAELAVPEVPLDPLGFVDQLPYPDRLREAADRTGSRDAVRCYRGTLHGQPVVLAAMDFRFLGGSLGTAAGEAVTTAAETALSEGVPLLLATASGGARMQEGALALMQMARTSGAMADLDAAGLLTATLVTDPTYGGVAASFAMLSDIVVAEPGARMGFAGPRVIAQTVRESLPPGFQTAEFLLRHGLIDEVRPRAELRGFLGTAVAVASGRAPADWGAATSDPVVRDPDALTPRPAATRVDLARHRDRPTTLDHLGRWLDGFVELHGDRLGADCPAVVGGIGILDGLPLLVLGHQKGHGTRELVDRNFGMATPGGYRKALRLMRLAAKLRLPVLTVVDTPGAHPGVDAEEQGQSYVIAECLRTLGELPVPVVSVITGEGGSGGALALAVADEVLLCENGIYSVISPEGCAAILWKSPNAVEVAARALRLGAADLLRLGVVDGVVPEPDGGAHRDPRRASAILRDAVISALSRHRATDPHDLVRARKRRFRQLGAVDTGTDRREPAR